MKDTTSIRGERKLWLELIHKTKKKKKKVWEVLTPFLNKYVDADEETRSLLILFPRNLADELVEEENPDELIEEAVRKYWPPKGRRLGDSLMRDKTCREKESSANSHLNTKGEILRSVLQKNCSPRRLKNMNKSCYNDKKLGRRF